MSLTRTRGPSAAAASSHIASRSSNGASALPNGVPKRRHQPELVDGRRLEHVQRRQLVRDVGRVEAAAEQRDAHRSAVVSEQAPGGATLGELALELARTAARISASGAPRVDGAPHRVAAGQQIDRRRVGHELVRLRSPAKVAGRQPRAPPRAARCRCGRGGTPPRSVTCSCTPPHDRPANLWNVGRNDSGRNRTPGRAPPAVRPAIAVQERRADDLERARRAPPLRQVGALEQALARIDERRVERRHVRRRHHPGQPGLRRSHRPPPAAHRRRPSGRSPAAARTARRPPRACRRHAGARSRRWSGRGGPARRRARRTTRSPRDGPALDRDAAQRVRAIEHDDRHAARAHAASSASTIVQT